MVALPKEVQDLLADKEAVKTLITAGKSGQPHAIVAGTIAAADPETMMIGQILFKQTAKNIEENPKVAFLVSKGPQSYEINAKFKTCFKDGPQLDGYNAKLKEMGLPFVASGLYMFDVCCVTVQSPNHDNGKKIA